MKPLGFATVISLAFLILVAGCAKRATPPSANGTAPTAQTPETGPVENKAAPDFSFTTLDGKTIKLSDLRGRPVVVNFWASWCHFCAQEAPDLEALYNQYKPEGLEVLGIGTDEEDAIRKKAKELKLTYPVGSSPQVAQLYQVSPIPHTFFINRKGVIVAAILGAQPKPELEAAVKKTLR